MIFTFSIRTQADFELIVKLKKLGKSTPGGFSALIMAALREKYDDQ